MLTSELEAVRLSLENREAELARWSSSLGSGLAGADLGGCHLQEERAVAGVTRAERIGRRVRRRVGGRHLAGKTRQVVLDGLELGDRALEGHALGRIAHGHVEHALQGTRHLGGPDGGADGVWIGSGTGRQRARARPFGRQQTKCGRR